MQVLRSHNPTLARPLVGAPRSRSAIGTARLNLGRNVKAAAHEDRDHPVGRPFDDPHQTPPPHSPPSRPPGAPPTTASGDSFASHKPSESGGDPSSWTFSSLATSDLELGNDAITGSTLETPEQLEGDRHKAAARLAQADAAREAGEAREAAQGIARLVLEGLREERAAAAAAAAPKEDDISDALFMNPSDAEEARAEEAAAAAQARANLAADESTAAEREDRYQGILQAIDSLGATEHRGASDPEDEMHSPEADHLMHVVEDQAAASFDAIRHTVDELGEGEEAAKLIAESYRGRNLEAEALSTMDPSDPMPHPGDRYLGRSALPSRAAPPGGMTPHLNQARSHFERRSGLLLPPARGGAAGQGQHSARGGAGAAWLPPGATATEAQAGHEPVGGEEQEEEDKAAEAAARRAGEEEADDQIGLLGGQEGRAASGAPAPPPPSAAAAADAGPGSGVGPDDQIDYEQDALRGADALYYASEHAAQPEVNGGGVRGGGAGGNIEAPEEFDVEGDALRGSDAMFYFKAAPAGQPHGGSRARRSRVDSLFYFKGHRGAGGGGQREPLPGSEEPPGVESLAEDGHGTVWGALTSHDEEHSSFRRALEEAAAEASSHGLAAYYRSSIHRQSSLAQGGGKHPGPLGRRAAVRAAAAAGHPAQPRAPPSQAGAGRAAAAARGGAAGASSGGGGSGKPQHGEGILASLRRRQEDQREAEQSMGQLADRPRGGRGPGEPKPPADVARVLEVATGRSAAAGLVAAVMTEVLTQQSVLSQLLGSAQLWLGRAAMALWVALIAYETVHSNRPAFGTLFYLWF
ncbi:E3 ubiquitin-ligase RNF213 isoform X1 [Micractinium conductrix]|uniref:E3 ubiquitin-ligase RNF213 isoform X1 n=1 Tax=Micractinium conductrix TaxID=554055 RepID=A0A2P6VNQ2_9CHLO|nr:E3 ubiquitin-ligase RNF213 isoform X1 [Micractinium conductrix]|eukprot:PSC75733.1 E3 ubiquitin-ligase RNF213 isoform X1 [Micractinium conductrix]